MSLEQVLEFHKILQAEVGQSTVVVTPLDKASAFHHTDVQTEYNRIYPLFGPDEIQNLVVDFQRVDYVDSMFIGTSLGLAKRAKAKKGRTFLCGLCDDVRELFSKAQLLENAKFAFFWSELPTRADALRELGEEE